MYQTTRCLVQNTVMVATYQTARCLKQNTVMVTTYQTLRCLIQNTVMVPECTVSYTEYGNDIHVSD
jgi:hypothetical protein